MGVDPDAPEPVDLLEREAERTRARNEGFAKICADRCCTPIELAAMPVGDVIGHINRVVGEDAARGADPNILPHYLKLFVESAS
jgi:hypothetical protein